MVVRKQHLKHIGFGKLFLESDEKVSRDILKNVSLWWK